jgi:alkaline phosphatase D
MKIAFGSCSHQDHPLPIFDEVVRHNPDVFIFLGDNIYGDTYNMDTLRAKYDKLGSKKSFQNLKQHVGILATWDDHDYGWNDSGRHYPYREETKNIFFTFFEEPEKSGRRDHDGIYNSYLYTLSDRKIQIILLDTRTFRDDLIKYDGEFEDDPRYFYQLDYAPHSASDSTLLGKEQWLWLEQELRKEADLRIIGTSTQFGIEYNGYEAWANFPYERQRLLELLKRHRVSGTLFISGDVHYAELSKFEESGLYPIYDITSSGLSETWHFATPNKYRIEGPVMDNNFGLLTLGIIGQTIEIKIEIWDDKGNQRIEHTIHLDELSIKNN